MSTGIYKITNLINGKCYIGQSVNIERRWKDERCAALHPTNADYNAVRSRAMRKYGIENFKFEIIEECSPIMLNEREQYWAEYYHAYIPDGYNVSFCGQHAWHWNALTLDSFLKLVDDLQNTTILEKDLAIKYGVCLDTISKINQGQRCVMDYLSYPLRQPHKSIVCPICGGLKDAHSNICINCRRQAESEKTKVSDEILSVIYYQGMSAAARILGITDKGLCKRLSTRNIPYRKVEYRQWYEQNILHKE